jgi:hypothetical protein
MIPSGAECGENGFCHTGRELLPTDDPPSNTLYLATRAATRHDPHIAHARFW